MYVFAKCTEYDELIWTLSYNFVDYNIEKTCQRACISLTRQRMRVSKIINVVVVGLLAWEILCVLFDHHAVLALQVAATKGLA